MIKLVTLFLICSSLIGYAQEKTDSLRMKSRQPGILNQNIRICAPSRASLIQKQPLYVIKYGKKETKTTAYLSLNLIQPNDITSLEILKDSASIAKYGDEAKNGAIIITLKKDKASDFKKKLKKYKAEQKRNDTDTVKINQ